MHIQRKLGCIDRCSRQYSNMIQRSLKYSRLFNFVLFYFILDYYYYYYYIVFNFILILHSSSPMELTPRPLQVLAWSGREQVRQQWESIGLESAREVGCIHRHDEVHPIVLKELGNVSAATVSQF